MNLTCPACGAPFSADDVHPQLGIANCRKCRGVLDLRAADRPLDMPTPPRFTVEESNLGLTLSWRWFRATHLLMLLFTVAWWSFLVVWYRDALRDHNTMAIVFPILHVGAGLYIGYTALTGLFNRTRIHVDCVGLLTVAHGPLPWPRPRPLRRDEVTQLYVQRVESRSRDDNGSTSVTVTYTLSAIDDKGKLRKLVGNLALDDARYLEWRLERQLKIPNRPVEGEATA
jgi:hypothetical protein